MKGPRRRILPLFIPHLGCPHDCVFCDQRRISGQQSPVTPADVTAALEAFTSAATALEPADEIAFYGGSFTALPLDEQRALLEAAVKPFLARGLSRGIRVSTRPDAVNTEVLSLLQRYHVTTVELGAQSMDDGVLRRCGRGHTAADTERACALLRDGGFRFVLQMMTGLPGSSDALDVMTGERLAALKPDGVRIYPTVILRFTPLYDLWRRGEYREHTVEDAVRVCARLLPLFAAAGIPVIRLGLNPSEELSGGEAAGGAYHPALGELVKSRVYLERARSLLRPAPPRPGADVTLGVYKQNLSQLTGQRRRNLDALRGEFGLGKVRVEAADVPPGTVVLL